MRRLRISFTPQRIVLVLFLCLTLQRTISWAQIPLYPPDAAWRSAPAEVTSSLAVCDVTGDGYLDLVSGNFNQPLRLYTRIYADETSPVWSSLSAARTFSVAIGDINGDNKPDLICGNDGQNFVYHNYGFGLNGSSVFGESPDWSSSRANATSGIAVGDVDDDGDLDLVCGNFNQPNVLYINTGSELDTVPAWSSDSTLGTNHVVLADVNGDNAPDLICANDGVNTVYLNTGEPAYFEPVPSWTSDSSHVTTSVVLADLDGDGDFDLVCGNADRANTIYMNEGMLRSDPMYWGDDTDATRSITLGDVDRDGDQDVLAGNRGQPNKLYLNIGGPGVFEATPSWSGPVEETAAILLADFDGDGSLDIAAGNFNESNTVYMNQTGPFGQIPVWQSNPSNPTLAVAVGEIDGIAGADVVFGNSGSNTIYRNDGAAFENDPGPWNPAPDGRTSGIALADFDGDTDLDVACGNWEPAGISNSLYFNINGSLEQNSSWSTNPSVSRALADADINADGRPDILVGNESRVNMLFLNNGAEPWFDQIPYWSSTESRATTDIAAGDVDGDGYIDLVCANLMEQNTFFHNRAGSLAVDPDWRSDTSSDTEAVILGDVDGDGDRDIVFGNDGQPNTLFYYLGPQQQWFAQTWSSEPSRRTRSVALGDIEGDGDLDLVCGNRDQANSVYENSNGSFSSQPIWNSLPENATESIALFDIDGDGDLDLVCANDGQPNTAYFGLRNYPFPPDPSSPSHHMVNNPPAIKSVTVEDAGLNMKTVRFTLLDVESDRVWMLAEYHYEGVANWIPCEGFGYNGLAGVFATNPAGRTDSIEWDISLLPFDDRPAELRLKLIELSGQAGSAQHLSLFVKRVGTIKPVRPQLVHTQGELSFHTVTVGDTAHLDLVIANHGNSDLIIDTITLPSPEMSAAPAANVIIQPGSSVSIAVMVHPLNETRISGSLDLASNDPLNPLVPINIVTDIRELAVNTRLLSPVDTIPLGEAVTIIVEPLPDVRVERGYLFHRPAGTSPFDSLALDRLGGDFIAVIPGTAVRERGIEYFVRVENSPAIRTDPPGAPSTLFSRAVEPPQAITVIPRPTLDDDFIAGRPIKVEVFLPRGAEFISGQLYFREGATQAYQQTALTQDSLFAFAEIPGSVVGARGVDYRIEVNTETAILSFPQSQPDMTPASIPVLIENLFEPRVYAGQRYRLFSIPIAMRGSILGSISDDLGGLDMTQWRLFAYDTPHQSYVELPNDSVAQFTQGEAYWLIARKEHGIDTGPDFGITEPTNRAFEIPLEPGYNLVAIPFTFTVEWSSMRVDTFAAPAAEGALVEAPIGWDYNQRSYVTDVALFEPWTGYWIKNLDTIDVTLSIPPLESPSTRIAQTDTLNESAWFIAITAATPHAGSTPAVLGIRDGASAAWDRFDHSMPPVAPGHSMAVYFPHRTWETHPDLYMCDIRGEYESLDFQEDLLEKVPLSSETSGHVWRFDVHETYRESQTGDETVLHFSGIDAVPRATALYLVDRLLGNAVDLRKNETYRFIHRLKDGIPDEESSRFLLVAGSYEYIQSREWPEVPEQTILHKNYPNPFNPVTTIRYDLAVPGHVRVGIYDVRGALVKIIADRNHDAGRFEIQWNGENEREEVVASGIYFCRMEARGSLQVQKMILLK